MGRNVNALYLEFLIKLDYPFVGTHSPVFN